MLIMHVLILHELAPTLVPDVSGMVGELITPSQVLAEEMVITSDCDDEEDDEGIASSKFEGNFSNQLQKNRVHGFKHVLYKL
jgi:hypothetical protein